MRNTDLLQAVEKLESLERLAGLLCGAENFYWYPGQAERTVKGLLKRFKKDVEELHFLVYDAYLFLNEVHVERVVFGDEIRAGYPSFRWFINTISRESGKLVREVKEHIEAGEQKKAWDTIKGRFSDFVSAYDVLFTALAK